MHNLCMELQLVREPIVLYQDNQSAIAVLRDAELLIMGADSHQRNDERRAEQLDGNQCKLEK